MKNKFTIIVFLVLLMLLFGACSNEVSQRQGTGTTEEPQTTATLSGEAPPRILPMHFDTVEELIAGFYKAYPE